MFDKFRNLKNMAKYSRHAFKMQECYDFVQKHTNKRCIYCDLELGDAMDFLVADFLNHLKENHVEKVDLKKIEKYLNIFS